MLCMAKSSRISSNLILEYVYPSVVCMDELLFSCSFMGFPLPIVCVCVWTDIERVGGGGGSGGGFKSSINH